MNVLHSSKKNFPPIKKVGFFGIPIDGRKSRIANNLICFIGLDLFHLTSRSSNKKSMNFTLETQSCYDSVFLSVVRSQSTLCLIYLSSLIYGSLFITACILQGEITVSTMPTTTKTFSKRQLSPTMCQNICDRRACDDGHAKQFGWAAFQSVIVQSNANLSIRLPIELIDR